MNSRTWRWRWVSSDMRATVPRMHVRGKHLFGNFLDHERAFVIGCEQAFGHPTQRCSRLRCLGDLPRSRDNCHTPVVRSPHHRVRPSPRADGAFGIGKEQQVAAVTTYFGEDVPAYPATRRAVPRAAIARARRPSSAVYWRRRFAVVGMAVGLVVVAA